MTTTSTQVLKHHNQTVLKSKYDGGPSWLLNVPVGWGSHHASHSIQRHNDSSTNESNFGQAYLQRFDELVELAFDDGETDWMQYNHHPLTTHVPLNTLSHTSSHTFSTTHILSSYTSSNDPLTH